MKKKILILLLIPFVTIAQDKISNERYQEIIMSVVEHVNDYERASKFTPSVRSDFKRLFTSPSTKIVNDIPALGKYSELISVDDYYNQVVSYYSKLRVKVSIVEITDINLSDENRGTLKVVVRKSVKATNTQNKIETVEDGEKREEFVREEDNFELNLYMSFSGTAVKITSISLAKPKGHLLVLSPHSKNITQRKDQNWRAIEEFNVLIDGEKHFIGDYFYSVNNINETTKIKIESNDERLKNKLPAFLSPTSKNFFSNTLMLLNARSSHGISS